MNTSAFHLKRSYVLPIFLLVFLTALLGTYLHLRQWAKQNFMLSEPLTLTELSRFAEIHFPPKTILVENEFHGGLSRVVYAKLDIPRNAVQDFLQQPRLKGHVSTNGSELREGGSMAGGALQKMHQKNWWPDKIQNYRAVDMLLRDGSPKNLNMVVGLDDPQKAVVYLYVMDG